MKKYGSLIALLVVVVLAIVLVVTKKEPTTTVEAPYSVPAVKNLTRVELTMPGEDGGLVVLEKSTDDWGLTKPVKAPVAERWRTKLAEELGTKINTDDIKLSADKAAEFGLDDENGTKVALFPEGATAPAAEFTIGKTISVEGTNAKRTYIKASDGEIYRAHTDLGEVLGNNVDSIRSKKVQQIERKDVKQITVNYAGGETVRIQKNDDAEGEWKIVEPADAEFELERSQVSSLLNSVSNLTASGFADDKKPADVGLAPHYAEVVVKDASGELHNLLLSKPVEDQPSYVKKKRGDHIFEIAETTANALTPTPLSLRSRILVDIPYDSVTQIEFGGEERVVVSKDGDGWKFNRGGKGKVKESALKSKLTSLTQLRAVRYEDVTPADAGLDKPAERLVIHTDSGKHTLLIGAEADKKGNLYGKWEDQELVMVIPQWIKERATPKASDLAEEES